MDVLPRITQQWIDRLREMSPTQRAISIACVLCVGLGFCGLLLFKAPSDFQPVSFGKVFGNDELVSAERALVSAGLNGFRRDGQRLIVPRKELDRYNAALLEFDALPTDLGSQMQKQYETLGPFSTDRQRQQVKEALLLQELRRLIKAIPDIEDARVAIATPERKLNWNQKPRATANVAITPRKGKEISATLVSSLRHVVASMVPDLQPADVTVFDVSRGQVHIEDAIENSADSRAFNRARELARQYEQQILKTLSHIPRVVVAVQVDLNGTGSSIAHDETNRVRTPTSPVVHRSAMIDDHDPHLTGFRGAVEATIVVDEPSHMLSPPNPFRVTVTIPRDYVREVARRRTKGKITSSDRRDLNGIEEEVVTKVERVVSRLIPSDVSKRAISVLCVDRLDGDSPDNTLGASPLLALDLTYVWCAAASLGIGLLISRSWWRRSNAPASRMDPSEDVENLREIAAPIGDTHESIQPQEIALDRLLILRDEVRTLIQNDPAASADLLGMWLSEAPQ